MLTAWFDFESLVSRQIEVAQFQVPVPAVVKSIISIGARPGLTSTLTNSNRMAN